ncbi:MAG: CRP/FNR family transcriptional regulator [Cyclobacteriaceae bacterium]|jgi:CRP/FNR family transcriptional regulator
MINLFLMNTPTAIARFNSDLTSEIMASSEIKDIPKNTQILREMQYVKVIPIVLDGLVKVFTRHEDKELLLYYIKPNESCVMSFAASLKNEPSKVYAITEEDSKILLLPSNKIPEWVKKYPDINTLFYQQYNLRYSELLETINHLLFNRLDARLYNYLKEKAILTNTNPLKISHRQIASELGTAREVITRVIKKLENEGKLIQHSSTIEILEL